MASLLGQRSSAVRADAAEVRATLERVRAEEPELLDDEMVVIAANPKELAASGRGYDKLTEAQLEKLGLSEGVHDTETGKSIIFTDQIELRPGETPRQAVTRVIEHERIGHEGVNFMIRTDPVFKTKWEALSKQIPSDKLQGLLENGYHDLANNPHALALEWLAQQVDKYKAAKTQAEKEQAMPGVARQLWQAVKDWIAKRRSRGGDVSQFSFDNEVQELLGRAHEAVRGGKTREDAKARTAEAPSRTRPDFIKLADSNNTNTLSHGQETLEIRDPRRALEAQRGGAGGRSVRSDEEATRVHGSEPPGQQNPKGHSLPRIDGKGLEEGIRKLKEFRGEEHDVYHDPASRRAVKLTKPGKAGAKGDLETYLQRLAWSNEIFGDDITVEGVVELAGESGPSVVTSQPWHTPDKETPHPEQAEIDQYMRDRGFLRAYDGAYIHESRDIVATDALPKNFVEDRNGILHPIDVILTEPGSEQHERLTNMARSQAQLEKTAETPPPPRMQHSQQSGRHGSDARTNLDVAKFRNILEHGDTTPLPADLPSRVQRAVAGSTRGGIRDSEVHIRQLDGVQLRSGQDDARIASAIAALFGRRVVGFDVSPKQFGGGLTNSSIPDAVLVNIAAEKPAMIVTGHELWHHLQLDHSDIADAVRKHGARDHRLESNGQELPELSPRGADGRSHGRFYGRMPT